jgi:hypothetical protein
MGSGLVSAYRWMGLVGVVVALLFLELGLAPITWVGLTELGYDGRLVLERVTPWCALAVLGVVGLARAAGPGAFLVVGLVLLSSPLVRGWSESGIRETWSQWAPPRARTRREFDAIVERSFHGDEPR